MDVMSDFGFTKADRTPVFLEDRDNEPHWISAAHTWHYSNEVTPVQVVGPGQVAVDAAVARHAATVLGRYGDCGASDHFRDALTAADDLDAKSSADDQTSDRLAEPAPDSGQGECPFCWDGGESVYVLKPLNPVTQGHMLFIPANHVIDATDDPDTTGRAFAAAAAYAKKQGEPFNLITSAGSDATQTVFHLHVHYVPRRSGDGLALPWTGQVKDTPAAEPERVTLPDTAVVPPEPPVGTWMRDRFGGVTLHQSDGWGPPGCHPFGKWVPMWEARGPYVECGPWGASEPPKAQDDLDARSSDRQLGDQAVSDPAETDDAFEQYQRELRHTQQIEDRAAKRGRDEALAVVVKAVEEVSQEFWSSDALVMGGVQNAMLQLRNIIEREQGGGGHE